MSCKYKTHTIMVNGLNPGVTQSVYGIYVSGQLSRDVFGFFKSNHWLSRDVIGRWLLVEVVLLFAVKADWSS